MRMRRPLLAATVVLTCLGPCVAAGAVASPRPHAASPGGPRRSLCAPPADTVGPSVTEVSFGKTSIDLNSGSRVQTVTVTASDTSGNGDPSGVGAVRIEVGGRRFRASANLTLTSGTASSGQWTGRFTVSKYADPGTYSVAYLEARDRAGNEQSYYGSGKYATSPHSLSLHPSDDPTFTVTGTPAKPPAGRTPGTLSSFTISHRSVDTTAAPKRVRFTADFRGARPGRVYLYLETYKKPRRDRPVFLRAVLRPHGRTWSGSVRVPQWLGDQTLQALLSADFGRRFRPRDRSYNAATLRRMGLPSTVTVVSGTDRSKPTLSSLAFSPSSIDSTSGAEQVTVTAHATDTGSGVDSVEVEGGIRHGVNGVPDGFYPHAASGIGYLSSDNFHVRLHHTTGTTWVGTTTVRQCVPSGTYKLEVQVRDAAENYHGYSTKALAKAGITSTVDVTSKHGDVAAPYVYSAATYGPDHALFLDFSEGVADVDPSTLHVFALSPRSARFTAPESISAITCANGTDTVDCSGSGGLVTSAELTIPSLNPGGRYEVYANLDQAVPQLVDGNGNPMQWQYAQTEVKDS